MGSMSHPRRTGELYHPSPVHAQPAPDPRTRTSAVTDWSRTSRDQPSLHVLDRTLTSRKPCSTAPRDIERYHRSPIHGEFKSPLAHRSIAAGLNSLAISRTQLLGETGAGTCSLAPVSEGPATRTTVHTSGARSFLRHHAYFVLTAIVALAMIGHTVNQTWASPDFWFHLASVRDFAHSPLDPSNPLIAGNAPDPYLSPYTFVLGVITRVTGASSVTLLATAGLFNMVLLFIGIRRFVECVSTVELAPVFTLLFTLLAWGLDPWRWSGFFELNSIGTVLPLSSTFASGLGLITIAALCGWLRGRGPAHLVVAGVGAPVVLLSHPITAVWVGALGIAFLVSEVNPENKRRLLALVTVLVGATLLAVAWPFYPVFGALVRSRSFDASNVAVYHGLAQRTFLALPGCALLAVRFLHRRKDPLAIGAALLAAVFVCGYVLHHEALGRVLPGLLLTAHVAMAVWLAEVVAKWPDVSAKGRYLISGTVAVIIVVGLAGSAAGVIRDVPPRRSSCTFQERPTTRELGGTVRSAHETDTCRRSDGGVTARSSRHGGLERESDRTSRARTLCE